MAAAVLYCRLSKRQDEKVASCAEQERRLRQEAKKRRLRVVDVFTDDGRTAYGDKERPAFERLKAALAAGDVECVLAVRMDRFARDEVEDVTFRALCRKAGVTIVADGREYAPDDDGARIYGAVEGAIAAVESAKKSKRVREAKEISRSRGAYMGSPRSFGYQNRDQAHQDLAKGALVVIEEEAEAIREGARLVLAGRGLRHVADVWNAHGITRPRGGEWDHANVGRVLRSERIAGLYDGRPAKWEAIISPETYLEVVAALTARDSGGRRTKGRGLLSGMIVCKECGSKVGRKRDKEYAGRRRWLYVCRGCNRNGASGERVNEVVAEEFLALVSDPKVVAKVLDTVEGDNAAELRSLLAEQTDARERLSAFAEDYAAGLITRQEYLDGRRVAAERVETLGREIDRAASARTFSVPAEEIVAEWDNADDEIRRAWLATLVDHVVLHRGRSTGPGNFDPARVEIIWRV